MNSHVDQAHDIRTEALQHSAVAAQVASAEVGRRRNLNERVPAAANVWQRACVELRSGGRLG